MKIMKEKLIQPVELESIKEKRTRVFKISYVRKDDSILRYEKIFQKKENLLKLLDDPNIIKTKIYVGDVVDE